MDIRDTQGSVCNVTSLGVLRVEERDNSEKEYLRLSFGGCAVAVAGLWNSTTGSLLFKEAGPYRGNRNLVQQLWEQK